jgi:hypothetical protein
MNSKTFRYSLCLLAIVALRAAANEPDFVLPLQAFGENQDAGKDKPKQPDKDKKPPEKKTPPPDVFSEALFPRNDLPTGFNPHMMGDFAGYFARQNITVFGTRTIVVTTTIPDSDGIGGSTTTTVTQVPTSQTKTILVPIAGAGAFKIAENESPRPQDRVFVTYNYFSAVRGPEVGPNAAFNSSVTTVNNPNNFFDPATTTTASTFIPPAPRSTGYLHRQIIGIEKTFLDGYASLELRVPLMQQSSSLDGFGAQFVGDLTIIGRYAFVLDQTTGNVLSAGLVVTAPTGPGIATIDGTIHSTYLQPWVGYIWNRDRFFVQGFHSIVVPTDSRDVTLLFNDVGVNWWLYRGQPNRLLTSVVPTVECHVTTPLNHRSGNDAVFAPDLVVLTSGVHLGIGRNSTFSVGVATPVTGPRVFGVEAFAQFNWRY